MIKIDIVSLSGLTAVDGSSVEAGAVIRFETTFFNGVSGANIRLEVYRSRELFEAGFQSVRVLELPFDFNLVIPDEEFYVMTPQMLYEKVKDELNNIVGGDYFEISITFEENPEPEEPEGDEPDNPEEPEGDE